MLSWPWIPKSLYINNISGSTCMDSISHKLKIPGGKLPLYWHLSCCYSLNNINNNYWYSICIVLDIKPCGKMYTNSTICKIEPFYRGVHIHGMHQNPPIPHRSQGKIIIVMHAYFHVYSFDLFNLLKYDLIYDNFIQHVSNAPWSYASPILPSTPSRYPQNIPLPVLCPLLF